MAEKSPYTGKVKIYSDGADKATMVEMANNPLIQGVTTQPTLMKIRPRSHRSGDLLVRLGNVQWGNTTLDMPALGMDWHERFTVTRPDHRCDVRVGSAQRGPDRPLRRAGARVHGAPRVTE